MCMVLLHMSMQSDIFSDSFASLLFLTCVETANKHLRLSIIPQLYGKKRNAYNSE